MFEPSISAYDDNFNNDFLVALVLLGLWAVLARRLYRLPYARSEARLRRSAAGSRSASWSAPCW